MSEVLLVEYRVARLSHILVEGEIERVVTASWSGDGTSKDMGHQRFHSLQKNANVIILYPRMLSMNPNFLFGSFKFLN